MRAVCLLLQALAAAIFARVILEWIPVPDEHPVGRVRRGGDAALLTLPALVVILVFFAATAAIVIVSFSVGEGRWGLRHYRRLVSDPLYLGYLWRSFRVQPATQLVLK